MKSKKEALYSNTHCPFNQTPGANGCLITKEVDKLVRPENTDATKKYFVKKKKSSPLGQKPEKAT